MILIIGLIGFIVPVFGEETIVSITGNPNPVINTAGHVYNIEISGNIVNNGKSQYAIYEKGSDEISWITITETTFELTIDPVYPPYKKDTTYVIEVKHGNTQKSFEFNVLSASQNPPVVLVEVPFNKQWNFDQYVVKYKHSGGNVEKVEFDDENNLLSITVDQGREGLLRLGIPRILLNSVAYCEETNYFVNVNGLPVSYEGSSDGNLRILEINLREDNEYYMEIQVQGTHSKIEFSSIIKQGCDDPSVSLPNPSWIMVADATDKKGIHVKSINSYEDRIGYFHIIGEVVNNQNTAYKYLKLVGTVYDKNGDILDTEFSYSEVGIIPPYGKSPFNISFRGGSNGVDEYGVQSSGDKTTPLPKNLVLSKPNIFKDNIGYTHIVGEVQNTGSQTANYVKIIASFYDEQKEIVGTSFTFAEFSDLYPGSKSPFEISENDFSSEPVSYELYVESNEYGLVFENPVSLDAGPNVQTQIDPPSMELDTGPSDQSTQIPEWIKNNTAWWAEGQIGDEDFHKGIEYLVNENIIRLTSVPDQQSKDENQKVPDWVKNNASWWADGQIDDDTFVQGIQFLIENGIIDYTPNQDVDVEQSPSLDEHTIQDNLTKRIDGIRAAEIISEWGEQTQTYDLEDATDRVFRDPSNSVFHVGIGIVGSWQGALGDGTSIRTIDGFGPALIPFKCQDVGVKIYNLNIQKLDESGDLTVAVIKNEAIIDYAKTSSPYGVVSLTGNCATPDL